MTLYKNKYRIESARKPGWDYGANGAYFITICTRDRRHFFGDIHNRKMNLSIAGEIAHKFWYDIPDRSPHVQLDAFVVMPNHIHGILIIDRVPVFACRDAINRVSTTNHATDKSTNPGGITADRNPMLSNGSISQTIRSYKGRCTFEIVKILPEFAWQPRFYDRILHDLSAIDRVRQYIKTNPERWRTDRFYR